MAPPPAEPAAAHGVADDRLVMTHAPAFGLLAACLVAAAWLALPHDGHVHTVSAGAAGAASLVCAAVLLSVPAGLVADRALQAILALVTTIVSIAIYRAG
ncbi:MAG: hypothetical protein QOD73_101, partial [Solirubrobacteraceae bacterium]|nr:hypothetical protein [Solirubrobacteraceae bacterium]